MHLVTSLLSTVSGDGVLVLTKNLLHFFERLNFIYAFF